jgi:O-antigen/teichoic acid export membrane protein
MRKSLVKFASDIINNKFIQNVFVVASGSAMAQVIGLLLLPIITRLYGPEAYGLLGSFLAITAILTPIAALTFPIAIVLPKNNSEAVSIILLSLKVVGIVVLLSTLILVIFHENVTELIQAESVSGYLYLVPIVILFSGLFAIMSQWLIRTNQYKIIASTTIYQPIIAYGGMIVIGLHYPFASVLIIITVFKNGITALLMYLKMKLSKGAITIDLNSSLLTSFATFKKYKDFPIYRAPEVLISSASQNIPILLLTILVNPAAAGFYTIGRTALGIPSQLIGKAVGDVFYPRISNASHNNESLVILLRKATLALAGIGILPFGIVMIAGPLIFTVLFGEEWLRAGEYAQWIALMSLAMFISRPAVQTLPVINAQRFQLMFTIVMTIARVGTLYYGLIVLNNDLMAVALFSVISSLLYILMIILTIIKINKFMR